MSFEEITKRLSALNIPIYETEVPRNPDAPVKLPYIVWGYENESFTGGDYFNCIRESDIFIELWENKSSDNFSKIIEAFSDTKLLINSLRDSKNHIFMTSAAFKNLQITE